MPSGKPRIRLAIEPFQMSSVALWQSQSKGSAMQCPLFGHSQCSAVQAAEAGFRDFTGGGNCSTSVETLHFAPPNSAFGH